MPAPSSAPASSRHWFEDHTGEVRLHVEAPTLAGVFEEAGRALAELMLEAPEHDTTDAAESATERIELAASDAALLLVRWLDELIFLSETRKKVYTELRVDEVTEQRLVARARGVTPSALRTAVKAATLHDLELARGARGWTARVILDV